MTSPDPTRPKPHGMLDGYGGIAAWANKPRADYEAEMLGRVVDKTEGIKLFDSFGKAKNPELAGLQDKTQELLGVIGYGHGYINGGWSGILGLGKRSITNDIGRLKGVTRTSGAYFLHSKGLWVADAHMVIDPAGFGVGEDVELQIRVYSPNGSLHFIRSNINRGSQRQTLTVHVPFTVPSAGYYVEFWADVAVARNVPMGSQWTGLSVEKRSMEKEDGE